MNPWRLQTPKGIPSGGPNDVARQVGKTNGKSCADITQPSAEGFKPMVQKKIPASCLQKYAEKASSVEKLVPLERNVADFEKHMLFSQNQTVFLLPGFQKGYSQSRSERTPDQRRNFQRDYFCE